MTPALRPYQDRMIDQLRLAFREVRRVLAVLPTGGGKTVVGCQIVRLAQARASRVLWLAHRSELIGQASAKLDLYGVPHGIIQAGHKRSDLSLAVQVASVQTMVRRLGKLTGTEDADVWGGHVPTWRLPFQLIVVDEAHHTTAASYRAILAAYPDAVTLGMSATPYRLDGGGLGDLYDRLVVGATVTELMRDGHLVRSRTYAPPAAPALATLKTRGGDFVLNDASDVMDSTAPIAEIVDTWKRRAGDRLTVGFACSVAHATHLAAAFRDAGIASAAIDGHTEAGLRDQRLAELAAGKVRVLWNCGLLTEGWDLPAIECVVLARPTKSRALWRQMVGRGLRSSPGKSLCLILDHAANAQRFGLPETDDEYSLQHELEAPASSGAYKVVVCPGCMTANDIRAQACAQCGRDLSREPGHLRSRPGRAAGGAYSTRTALELEEFRGLSEEDQRRIYVGLLGVADDRNFAPGWAAHRYRERFGKYPPHSWLHDYHAAHA